MLLVLDVASEYKVKIKEEKLSHIAFKELIMAMADANGVVVLIDEYDSPLLKKLYEPSLKEIKETLSGFYSQLKANEEYIRFVFLTGITKFSNELDGLYVTHEFMSDHDIEDASPESFLTQAGYLTIKEIKRNGLILGFPNYEVKQTLSRHLLKNR